jgi:3,4-dihydroxy 2-butanone 4-phosphate synthase/GTP cyclohydrolase II
MHHLNIINDCLTNLNNPKSGMLNLALQKINQNKSGIIVIIRQPAESIINLLDDIDNLQQIRNYGIGAQILSDLNISKMTLLTNSPKSVIGFDGYKIKISGYQKLN